MSPQREEPARRATKQAGRISVRQVLTSRELKADSSAAEGSCWLPRIQ